MKKKWDKKEKEKKGRENEKGMKNDWGTNWKTTLRNKTHESCKDVEEKRKQKKNGTEEEIKKIMEE